jgi:hypothetical protein
MDPNAIAISTRSRMMNIHMRTNAGAIPDLMHTRFAVAAGVLVLSLAGVVSPAQAAQTSSNSEVVTSRVTHTQNDADLHPWTIGDTRTQTCPTNKGYAWTDCDRPVVAPHEKITYRVHDNSEVDTINVYIIGGNRHWNFTGISRARGGTFWISNTGTADIHFRIYVQSSNHEGGSVTIYGVTTSA